LEVAWPSSHCVWLGALSSMQFLCLCCVYRDLDRFGLLFWWNIAHQLLLDALVAFFSLQSSLQVVVSLVYLHFGSSFLFGGVPLNDTHRRNNICRPTVLTMDVFFLENVHLMKHAINRFRLLRLKVVRRRQAQIDLAFALVPITRDPVMLNLFQILDISGLSI